MSLGASLPVPITSRCLYVLIFIHYQITLRRSHLADRFDLYKDTERYLLPACPGAQCFDGNPVLRRVLSL